MKVIDIQERQRELIEARDKAVEKFICARAEAIRWEREIHRIEQEMGAIQ